MATINNHIRSRNPWPALLAALGMTAVLGLAIAALGINALSNRNVVPKLEVAPADQFVSSDQATVGQLQELIAQYQSREQQYQLQLQQAADQLNAVESQLQQYQGLVGALQQAGIIQITADGRVLLGRGAFGNDQGEGDHDKGSSHHSGGQP